MQHLIDQAPPKLETGQSFTIQIHPAGIGDVLQQLTTLYVILFNACLTYFHSPVVTHQCKDCDFDTYLGLGVGEKTISEFKSPTVVGLGIKHFKNGLLQEIHKQKGRGLLYSFNLGPDVYELVHQDRQKGQLDENFRRFKFHEKYWYARQQQPLESGFDEHKIKVAVHIRRGDCVGIEKNGKMILPFLNQIVPIDRFDWFSGHENVVKLLNTLLNRFGRETFDIHICSEGHLSYEQTLMKSREIEIALKNLENEFKVFRKYPNVKLFVGNSHQKTLEAIHHFATADVIIKRSNSCFPNIGVRCRKKGDESIVIHASSYDNTDLKKIGELIQRRSCNVEKASRNKAQIIFNGTHNELMCDFSSRLQRKINLGVCRRNLKLLKSILDRNKIPFWLLYGTCLGAIRDKDIMPHDIDIDIGLHTHDKERVLALMPRLKELGFSPIRTNEKGNYLTLIKKNETIDMFFISGKHDIFFRPYWICEARKFPGRCDRFDQVKFLGETFLVPDAVERYLRFLYGPNWKRPVDWLDASQQSLIYTSFWPRMKNMVLTTFVKLKHHLFGKPEHVKLFNKRLNFFSQLVSSGELCFDIGANVGELTEVFLSLDARVVAAEPQKKCLETLAYKFLRNKNLTIVNKALDRRKGMGKLFVCDQASIISTMSEKWTKESSFARVHTWNRRENVPITTLDELIREHGKPKFCKIDVEGFEESVLAGLSQKLDLVSFEFTGKAFFEETKRCLNHILELGGAEFNLSIGESNQFVFDPWVSADMIIKKLDSLEEKNWWGDIYARFL